MSFIPVTAPNITAAIIAQIRELIASDVLQPGDQLPGERELAVRMDVSRTSIRSALQALVTEGLLVSRHGSGFKVSTAIGRSLSDPLLNLLESSEDAISDYLRFRKLIEGESVAEVANSASGEEKKEIRRFHEMMCAAFEKNEFSKISELDIDFHMALVEATGNLVTIQVARSLQDVLSHAIEQSHLFFLNDEKELKVILSQHEDIVKAIEEGAANKAKRALLKHLEYQEMLWKKKQDMDRRDVLSAKRKSWSLEVKK
ncbi:MAG: FadR/GntR family transcriptional regulator [Rhodomicrobiaceae bacterium]